MFQLKLPPSFLRYNEDMVICSVVYGDTAEQTQILILK